ncbi:MAG: hypothetical protein Q8J84_08805 [Flavobacteriaceae bacterium]|nr:hypothetical protein [Flavobacteriaceae bacterium]
MKKEIYLILIAVIGSVSYGIYSSVNLLFENKTPYTISCEGILLDSSKVYAISNYYKYSTDTIFIHYEQSKVIMPSTLGYLFFDKAKNEFVLVNHASVFNPIKSVPENYFLPFCRTLNDSFLQEGIYFNGGVVIPQNILTKRGIKYNNAVGTRENRISIELIETKEGLVLAAKDDGIKTKYLLKRNSENFLDVYLNHPIQNSICPTIFSFENTTNNTGKYTINVTPKLFFAKYNVTNASGHIISSDEGRNPTFYINEFLFTIKQKYSVSFAVFFIITFILIGFFQSFFVSQLNRTASPVLQSLLSFRILLNSIAFMAIPLFLSAYYLAPNRIWYLPLLLLLNFTFFIRKDAFSNLKINLSSKYITYIIWVVIISCPIVFIAFSVNEKLFGVPVLHYQKVIILLLFFVTQRSSHHKWNIKYQIRVAFILLFTLLISFITSDLGSFIYAGLSIVIVELVRKSLKPNQIIVVSIGIIAVVFMSFQLAPEWLSKDRKGYRIVAPYVNPDSKSLLTANQADRESYSNLMLNLKNIQNSEAPRANDLIIPGSMRSTSHSDFAFYWSFTFGGYLFLILYLFITYLIVSKILFLLYCSVRVCRVQHNLSFTFPKNREAELIRFLTAFTIIGFLYPVASNLLLIPLTGQSIPMLSISNVELLFLIFLVVSLESIFNNPHHYTNINTDYTYTDMKKSIQYGIFLISSVFIVASIVRYSITFFSPELYNWKKHFSNDNLKLERQIPDKSDKDALVHFGKTLIGNDALTMVDRRKKPILKNLASLYFSNKPYSETIYESKTFSNSSKRMKTQMSIDSIFSMRKSLISGFTNPFGNVYGYKQLINNRTFTNVSNKYYSTFPIDATTINTDLTAEVNEVLEKHLAKIGIKSNIGSIMIIQNKSGGIVTNSSYPFNSEINSNDIYYFVGSLKKTLLAYCALTIDPNFMHIKFGDVTFENFIKNSDDFYAANLLKVLLISHQVQFDKVLKQDFDMSLFSTTDDAFLDVMPSTQDYIKPLDRNNNIYRQAIGQQRPYQFINAIQWYARIASMNRINLNYFGEHKRYNSMNIGLSEYTFLKNALNNVLAGTASNVGNSLKKYNIETSQFIAKTGTSEKANKSGNSSSSFIIANENYTIGIMLNGTIPQNKELLAAKDLFNTLIPLLIKYKIF